MIICISVGCTKDNEPKGNMFEIGVKELTNVQVNRPFEIVGYLKNNSKHSWEITHGSGIFSYEVIDENENPVPQEKGILFRNDVGYFKELEPKEIYSHNGEGQRSKGFYEFTIKKPGKYKVKVNAEFRIEYKGNEYDFKLTSNELHEFTVK